MDELEQELERWSGVKALIIKIARDFVGNPTDAQLRIELRTLLQKEESCRKKVESAALKRYL